MCDDQLPSLRGTAPKTDASLPSGSRFPGRRRGCLLRIGHARPLQMVGVVNGGACRGRTDDLFHAMEALSQLS
jgi:hypothetical protein